MTNQLFENQKKKKKVLLVVMIVFLSALSLYPLGDFHVS